MATLNYENRLANLRDRRLDKDINKAILSESISAKSLPSDLVYLIESMRPIDKKYNDKTVEAAENVRKHIENGLTLIIRRVYRGQGSVKTNTNIKLYSDYDLLTIIDRYYYTEGPPKLPYNETNPDEDIQNLRRQTTSILKNIYDEVDDTPTNCVSIYNKNLKRKVDVVFSYWHNSNLYESTGEEYYRGIHLYNFPKGPRKTPADFPFAHITEVNKKGERTNDGARKGIRLLKTLRADSDRELKILKSFEITSIVHSIEDQYLYYQPGNEVKIAQAISNKLQFLIQNEYTRNTLLSPNGKELPLLKDGIVADMKSIKSDLDKLIADAMHEISTNYNGYQYAIRNF